MSTLGAEIIEHLKETYCSYLETAYKLGNATLFEERSRLLREDGAVTRVPFLETTPRFESGEWLRDISLAGLNPNTADLVGYGLTTDSFPLYRHQQTALESAWDDDGNPRSFVVASGTGSGKTECFYLPILSDILSDAATWSTPSGDPKAGRFDRQNNTWIGSRSHETRPAAIRGLVLYPTNALVNDQLKRLRVILSSDEALNWQHSKLSGNRIYFGRYTGHTPRAGSPLDQRRRRYWDQSYDELQRVWEQVNQQPDLASSGGWQRPDGAEMLCRWDMQAQPPDVLVTNYSMLEYMLVRPIESPIFAQTRAWLEASNEHHFTLVLDEAHTYSGARGTEVAFLIRRLVDRLGIRRSQLRFIATSASLGESRSEVEKAQQFVGDLFGIPAQSLTIIGAARSTSQPGNARSHVISGEDYAALHKRMRDGDPIEDAASTLLESSNGSDFHSTLYRALEGEKHLSKVRSLTAGSAQPMEEVAVQVFSGLEKGEALAALGGLLDVGTAARLKTDLGIAPPLLPSRLHLMFRGIAGLWACINPACSVVPRDFTGPRPIGRLYLEPEIWCACGGRILEVMTCRICGYIYLGGAHEVRSDGVEVLWPFGEDRRGLQDYRNYAVFAVEPPDEEQSPDTYFDIKTATRRNRPSVRTRPAWDYRTPEGDGVERELKLPRECPSCGSRRGPNREIIEDLRTSGQAGFGILAEDVFRLQPPTRTRANSDSEPDDESGFDGWFAEPPDGSRDPDRDPNLGRKLIVFSDGRQDAALLAGDLQLNHERDLRRQVLMSILSTLDGPIGYEQLRRDMMNIFVRHGIDPSFDEINYWRELDQFGRFNADDKAAPFLDAFLRSEITQSELAIAPLGLGQWLPFVPKGDPRERLKEFSVTGFSHEDSAALLIAVFNILLQRGALAPSSEDLRDWPNQIVDYRFTSRIVKNKGPSNAFVWSAERDNKLTKYLQRVIDETGVETTLAEVMDQLWDYRKAIALGRERNEGFVIRIDRLAIAPPESSPWVCANCGYLTMHTVAGVCLRCRHGRAQKQPIEEALRHLQGGFYRRVASFSGLPQYPDPFPLRILEHTAQISTEKASQRERFFQDQFLETGDEPEDRLQHRVDGLSVTTTMEMGIDIGDLNAVGLRNIPPSVANYQQRAGRAGRRGSNVAIVFAFARDRSHDRYYFQDPAAIITGSVRLPRLHLGNLIIAKRHANAVILQDFFQVYPVEGQDLFGSFGTVLTYRAEGRHQKMIAWTQDAATRHRLNESLGAIFLGIKDDCEEWLMELPATIEEALSGVQEDSEVLDVLIRRGVLPRYAFPVDVVSLWTERPDKYSLGSEVARGLDIALSEFAPGATNVIDKLVYESAALYEPFEEFPSYRTQGWYFQCEVCQTVHFDPSTGDPSLSHCPECRVTLDPINKQHRAIRPSGFATDWKAEPKKYRGGGRERAGFASRATLAPGDYANGEGGTLTFDDRLWVRRRTGDLYLTNKGPDPRPGFLICRICGRAQQDFKRHTRPTDSGGYSYGANCPGALKDFERLVLVHSFRSDVAVLGPNLPADWDVDSRSDHGWATWLSAAAAIEASAAIFLQIDPNELAAGTRPWNRGDRLQRDIYLYDTVPNGAGYARDAADNLEGILRNALKLTTDCPSNCSTACYQCLLDYGNQREHSYLNRHIAADLLGYLLDGVNPVLSDERRRRALDSLLLLAPRSIEVHKVEGLKDEARRIELDGSSLVLYPTHAFTGEAQSIRDEIEIETGLPTETVSEYEAMHRPLRVWQRLQARLQV